jgi:hypothetical protein
MLNLFPLLFESYFDYNSQASSRKSSHTQKHFKSSLIEEYQSKDNKIEGNALILCAELCVLFTK